MWPNFLGSEGWPILKMAMFEDEIRVSKDKGVGPIGPRATSMCSAADISPLPSVEVI